MAYAQNNPFGIPTWVLGVAVAGTGGWVFSRLSSQRKLAELLMASPDVMAVQQAGLVDWTPQSKASEMITFTNALTAQQAYLQVMAEVRELMPEGELDIGGDLQRAAEEKLEETKAEAAGLYQSLPDVPFIESESWLPAWVTGAEEGG